jgi:glycine betaine/proline transport system substrate-binding protein
VARAQVREGSRWLQPPPAKKIRRANVGQFLQNYTFTLAEQSRMAKYVTNEDLDYAEAGRELIRNNPELIQRWFASGGMYQDGPVQTADGERNAAPVIRSALEP